MPEPGGLSSWRGRGRGHHSPNMHHTSINSTSTFGQRISPPIPTWLHPLPLKIVPCLGGTRRPLLDNHALCPIVCNPVVISQPHPYAFHDPNAPLYYDDLFPPSYNTLCLQVTASMTQTQRYSPPESFPLDPLLPTPYLTPSHNQSLMTLMCFPQTPLIMILILIGICNPSPHTPLYLNFKYIPYHL